MLSLIKESKREGKQAAYCYIVYALVHGKYALVGYNYVNVMIGGRNWEAMVPGLVLLFCTESPWGMYTYTFNEAMDE